MDNVADSSPYLKYFNDKPHNFLLPSNEETLVEKDACLNVEPIFTEIDCTPTWPVEGLHFLLNGSLIAEDQTIESSIELDENKIGLGELYNDNEKIPDDNPVLENVVDNESPIAYPIVSEIPGKGFITADGLFLSNELLMQLNLQSESSEETEISQQVLFNSKTFSPVKKELFTVDNQILNNNVADNDTNVVEISSPKELNLNEITKDELFKLTSVTGSSELIQLVNSDGTVINIDKALLTSSIDSNPKLPSETCTVEDSDKFYEDMFEIVTARKCKECSFLCELPQDMIRHLKNNHVIKNNIILKTKVLNSCTKNQFNNNHSKPKMRSILNINRNKDTKQTVFLCSECNRGYASKDDLKNHMILNHNLINTQNVNGTSTEKIKEQLKKEIPVTTEIETSTTTTITNTITKLSTSLIKKQQKASKKNKCTIKGCDLRFARDDLRRRHEECHVDGQKKQFKCPVCKSKFSIWRICSAHLWKCHSIDVGLLTCPMCSKFKSISAVRLLTHMAIHDTDRPFLCNTCGKAFKQHTQLKNHEIIHKDPEIDEMPKWANQQQCETCEKYFANSKSLKKHIQTVHHKFKPFICNICGHKTARKAMLDLHLRQHTGEKPHHCPICEYKTGDHNCLRRHIMRHKGDTKYSCPHCDYQSIQSTSYKHHIATKHPGKGGSFYCTMCSYHTVNENAYFVHMKDHEKLPKINGDVNNSDEKVNEKRQKANESGLKDFNNILCQSIETEDEETQSYFLNGTDQPEDTVDRGGITIPAGFELQVIQ